MMTFRFQSGYFLQSCALFFWATLQTIQITPLSRRVWEGYSIFVTSDFQYVLKIPPSTLLYSFDLIEHNERLKLFSLQPFFQLLYPRSFDLTWLPIHENQSADQIVENIQGWCQRCSSVSLCLPTAFECVSLRRFVCQLLLNVFRFGI